MSASSHTQYDVSPSDMGQSIFRLVLVSVIVIWTYTLASRKTGELIPAEPNFQFAIVYLLISLLIFVWTFGVLRKAPADSRLFSATRVLSVFTDVGAVSFYTALSGADGVILYPIYLTCIIGYGYRFGVPYLYLTLAVSAVTFALALQANSYLAQSTNLIAAYYLSIVIVPLYATSLLKQHRLVLDKIREVNAARSRFIANMSHELRTPLHAIISVSDLLGEELSNHATDRESQVQKVRMIGDSGQHLLNLVNRVLDIASADAGGVGTVKRAELDLKQVVLSSIRICQPNAERKQVRFFWFYDLRLPRTVDSSAEYLQEILINTIGNAVKYTQEGHVHVSVTLAAQADSPVLRVEIADTGIGIPEKLLPTIFEPFTLGDDSAARRYSGTGLGLTLTKKFVEYLDGSIEFDSIEKVGTRCTINLPLTPVAEPASGDSARTPLHCVLFSSGAGSTERESFARAGWLCRQLPASSAETAALDGVMAIFVDCASVDAAEDVLKRVAARQPHAVIVLYGAAVDSARPPLLANASVGRDDVSAIEAAHELTYALFEFGEAAVFDDGMLGEPVDTKNILIADDNPTNLKTAQLALESQGHRITLAHNGEEALAELEANRFDIAFIDLHMPTMSGIEVTQIYQYLVTDDPTPIVILTADVTADASRAAADAGATAFLTKPLRVAEIRRAVQKYSRGAGPSAAGDDARADSAVDAAADGALIKPEVICEFLDIGVERSELIDMIGQFETDGEELLKTLADALARADFAQIAAVLHSLKGACATVGAERMERLAQHVSAQVKDGGSNAAGISVQALVDVLHESSARLRQTIEQHSPRDPAAV